MTRRHGAARALLCAVVLLVAACTSHSSPRPSPPSSLNSDLRGGTVRVGLETFGDPFDPAIPVFGAAPQIEGRLLVRTLLAYNGKSTREGGTTPRPDLASSLPTVSADGLTWTFHLKHGIRYAPPLQRVQITAPDFVRAFLRELAPSPSFLKFSQLLGYSADIYFEDVIEGARPYSEGKASAIAGLETPDRYTLRVHLTHPDGDFEYRVALPQVAPIPPSPADPAAPFGVATGHEGDYGYFLAASGPYRYAGSEDVDYSAPVVDQAPPSGMQPGSITLVRNPSWDPATDNLRAAYPDRIVLVPTDPADAIKAVEDGKVDVAADALPTAQQVDRYRNTPHLRGRLFEAPDSPELYLLMNVALPPLDDLHVRRAVNYAFDHEAGLHAFVERLGQAASVATHAFPDSTEDDLLLNSNPYGPSFTGNLAEARREMAASAYDRNHDGVCDASVCRHVPIVVKRDLADRVATAHALKDALAPLGIHIVIRAVSLDTFQRIGFDPASHIPLEILLVFSDYPSASLLAPLMFSGQNLYGLTPDSCCNLTALGADASYLAKFHYPVSHVPSVDDRIQICQAKSFGAAVRCWTDLDQYVMREIAPVVPLVNPTKPYMVSERVARFSIDPAAVGSSLAALDRIALTPAARAEPAPTVAPSPVPSEIPAIPDGTYRFTISDADARRFGVPSDQWQENTGTTTMQLSHGRWRAVQESGDQIFRPLSSGVYSGSGDTATFVTQLPLGNSVLAMVQWRLAGTSVLFTLLQTVDPLSGSTFDDPVLRAFWEAHAWKKVG